jgi:hypothetical protein
MALVLAGMVLQSRPRRALEQTVESESERLAEAEERYRRLVEELPLITYVDAPDHVGSTLGYMQDITERKALESRLANAFDDTITGCRVGRPSRTASTMPWRATRASVAGSPCSSSTSTTSGR